VSLSPLEIISSDFHENVCFLTKFFFDTMYPSGDFNVSEELLGTGWLNNTGQEFIGSALGSHLKMCWAAFVLVFQGLLPSMTMTFHAGGSHCNAW
jgi:hypothetical protein